MKKIKSVLSFLLPVFIFLFSCSEDDSLPTPTSFIASDGTYLGVIHLAYEGVPGAEIYEVYRLNNQTAEWQDISWTEQTNWDDQGYLLNNGEIVPGEVYQYKFRTHANGPGFGPYSEIETGYSFVPDEIEIISITRDNENNTNKIVWNDPNDYSNIQNITTIEFDIYSATEDNLDNFSKVGSSYNLNYNHYLGMYDTDKVYYYKIVAKYTYGVVDQHWSNFNKLYELSSDMTKEGSGGDGPDIISYTKTDLGTVSTSGESIAFTEIKQNGSNLYLGIFKDVAITGDGMPGVFKFNGSGWTEFGGALPTDIVNSSTIGAVGIASASSKVYLGALSSDSIYIVETDGSSWSNNLSRDNLGYSETPSAFDLEVLSDEVYLAVKVYPDWDLKVYKWSGTAWQTIGGDANGFITSGEDVFDVTLDNLNGTLYLSYHVDNSSNNTFHIKHLNGTSWDNDLEWTAEYITNLKIAKSSSDLYFISRSESLGSYKGGVYKVTSSTTVEELINENNTWFYTPYDITIDSDGNVIISSIKYESETLIYPSLSLYNGATWSTISGDFSEGIKPVSVHADGTSIYYIYGDKTNVTSWGDTKSLKSVKFTK
ncbi:MAG: hypothetical protein C0597_16200 [Marinilabiliales bacterium]|nr:MAG: hypothetical protein C0597_16200 [Marinilabiliales bacterium]